MASIGVKFIAGLFLASCIIFYITVVHYEDKLSSLQSRLSSVERRLSDPARERRLSEPEVPPHHPLVIYNRVPKTGSTTLMGVAYDLCGPLGYNVLHLNTSRNAHVMSMTDQMEFVTNITSWKDRLPALYHGHIAFIDFAALGLWQRPLWLNVVRRPLERLVSHYYFLRYGDDFRPHLVRTRSGNTETFDDCVRKKHKDCKPTLMWLQVPFFCGMMSFCWEPGSRAALEQAQYNLVHHYLLVGTTERLPEFVSLLENLLPGFFRGAVEQMHNGGKDHLRKTQKKPDLLPETVEQMQASSVWQVENEFYHFVERQFDFALQKTLQAGSGGRLLARPRAYHYEKIRPK